MEALLAADNEANPGAWHVHTTVVHKCLEAFAGAIDTDAPKRNNIHVVANRQQGKTTMLVRFLKSVITTHPDIKIGYLGTSKHRYRDLLAQLGGDPYNLRIEYVRDNATNLNFLVCDKTEFLVPDKLACTADCNYISFATLGHNRPHNIDEEIDIRWSIKKAEGGIQIIGENIPPWINADCVSLAVLTGFTPDR
jgi:hypothetical protein